MQSELVYAYTLPLLPWVPLIHIYITYAEHIYIIMLVLCYSYAMIKFVSESKFTNDKPDRPLSRFKHPYPPSTVHANIWIYIDTAVVLLISYASLLYINLNYICFAIFPIITFGFISTLCIEELCDESRSKEANVSSTGTSASKDEEKKTKSRLELKAISVVPYWVLHVMRQFHHTADKYAISHFLLFLSSTLGALTLMMARLVPTEVTPGLARASELLHKASLVALLVTVHTVAAELIGEDVVMFCLPEFVPVLLWFSVHLDRDKSIITVDKIKRHKSGLFALGTVVVAAFAYLEVSMDESGLSRCTKTLASCGVSGLLIYCVVFMLCQWPGQAGTATTTSLKGTATTTSLKGTATTTSLKGAVELLQLWANVLLIAAAPLLVLWLLPAWSA